MKSPAVGSTVRVASGVPVNRLGRSGGGIITPVSRRAIVATAPDTDGRISLVQDDLAPSPLKGRGNFLVAPMLSSVGLEEEECEVKVEDVTPLLPFEREDHAEKIDASDVNAQVEHNKGYGDQVFRLNDYTSAIAYYEAALSVCSTKYSTGGALVAKRKGHAVIAEIDCIENDGSDGNAQYDVTFITGEEGTISQKEDVLLALWSKDDAFLQPRILMNLARCLLKLGDVDAKTERRAKYRLAAVLGCSIALTLCEYHGLETDDTMTIKELGALVEKARILRSRAFLGLRKYPHATIDAKKALAQNSSSREAQKLLKETKIAQSFEKSMDRKLSKEVCRWVQSAALSSEGAEAINCADGTSVSDRGIEEKEKEDECTTHVYRKRIDAWKIVRSLSMEIAGLVAFFVAMLVLGRNRGESFER
ncbi:hypothetical protein ACHAXT_005831 [Thalassiosira profunda]